MVQQAVTNRFLATGIPGEFARSENQRSRVAIINSSDQAQNVVGKVVISLSNDEEVQVSNGSALGAFAGILSCPKALVRQTLDAQSFIENGSQVEVAESGYLFVNLTPSNVGDYVYYYTDGAPEVIGTLVSKPPTVEAPADTRRVPGGIVTGYTVTEQGVAEISFDINGSTEVITAP